MKIDSHVHIYSSAEAGAAAKEGYEIWEYGEKHGVCYSALRGTLTELVEAMQGADIAKAVLVNLFSTQHHRNEALGALSVGLSEAERARATREIDAKLAEDLVSFNRWACELIVEAPGVIPFVAADPQLLPDEAGADHVREMVQRHGARGVKLHGPVQGFHASDERLWPVYRLCEEMALPIVAHSGPDAAGAGLAEPRAFAPVLEAFPRLRLVIAHLGGGTWAQALEIAQRFDNAYFDCCEIIEWTDSPNGPTERELGQLIVDIGPQRVMMGSDYPWYDLDRTVDRVMELPVLSREEKEGIAGANAIRILNL